MWLSKSVYHWNFSHSRNKCSSLLLKTRHLPTGYWVFLPTYTRLPSPKQDQNRERQDKRSPTILPQISNLSQEMSVPCPLFFLTIVTPLGRELTKSLTPRWSGSERTWRWHESSVARWPPGQPRQSESLGCKHTGGWPSDPKQNVARCGMWTETSLESTAVEAGHGIHVSFVNSFV